VLGLEREYLVIGLVRVLRALDVVFVGDNGFLLDFAYLATHLVDRVMSKEYLLPHYVDLSLQELIPPDCVIQPHPLVCQQVQNVPPLDFLLVEVLLAGDHLLDFVFLLVKVGEHLLALVLED